ncbi:MAG: hypothetical protein Q8P38_03370 [Candidatus Nanopelagicales bacterium]|nr:hypothetical protein [Candidatus Nanopelagicales bacterium]
MDTDDDEIRYGFYGPGREFQTPSDPYEGTWLWRPGPARLAESRESFAVSEFELRDPRVDRCLEALRAGYSGVEFGAFSFSGDAVLDLYAGHWDLAGYGFLPLLLSSEAARSALPGLIPAEGVMNEDLEESAEDYGRLCSQDAFCLDGEIARLVGEGGPYQGFRGTDSDVKDITVGFVAALLGESRYRRAPDASGRWDDQTVVVLDLGDEWSDWFYSIAWDRSHVVVDHHYGRAFVLCVTATD